MYSKKYKCARNMKAPSELIIAHFNYCCVFSAPSRFLIGPTLRGKRPFAQVCAQTFILRFLGFMDIPWQIPCLGNCFYSSFKWYLSQWCQNRGARGEKDIKIQVKMVATLCRLNVEHWLSHIQENIRCDELNSARWVQFYFSMTLVREDYNLEFWNNVAKTNFFSKIKRNIFS